MPTCHDCRTTKGVQFALSDLFLCRNCDKKRHEALFPKQKPGASKSNSANTEPDGIGVRLRSSQPSGEENAIIEASEPTTAGEDELAQKKVCQEVVVNEVLCFLFNKMDTINHDLLLKVCMDFYESSKIEAAKMLLFSFEAAKSVTRCVKRQGPSRDKCNVDDILRIFHSANLDDLPVFTAANLSRLPPADAENIDFSLLFKEFQSMRKEMMIMKNQLHTISSSGSNASTPSPEEKAAAPCSLTQGNANHELSITKKAPAKPEQQKLFVDLPPLKNQEAGKLSNTDKAIEYGSSSATYATKCSMPIPVSEDSTSVEPEDGFTPVLRRKKRKPLIGTSNKTSSIKATSHRKLLTVFVSRLEPNTCEDDIKNYVRNNLKLETSQIEKLKTKFNTYASFAVKVYVTNPSVIFDTDSWPEGVYVRKFYSKTSEGA